MSSPRSRLHTAARQMPVTASTFTIYNASAGSGKTYTLAVQYIARLIAAADEGERPYRQVLAVTFTNKATAEMKDRILQQLYGVGYGLKSSDGYLKSIAKALVAMGVPRDSGDIRRAAKKILSDILHDYSHFRVETIDSFFRTVFTDMARELGLPAGLRADIDQRRAISEAVDRIIDRIDSNPDIRQWITQFVRERMNEGERWDVSKVLKDFSAHLFDQPYLNHQKELTAFLGSEPQVKQLRSHLEKMRRVQFARLEEAAASVEATAGGDIELFSYSADIVKHLARLRGVQQGGDMPTVSTRLNGFIEDHTKLLKGKDKSDAYMQGRARQLQQALAAMIDTEKEAARQLNSINLTRQNLNPMRLLNAVGATMNEVTQEKGAFLLANTPLLLGEMVKAGDAPFMYEKMGTILRHIMLDEFQDTSGMQWGNFQTLIHEVINSLEYDMPGSTLVVGDIKQSIYRWRGGDWKILDKLPQTQSNVTTEELSTNYRSASRIIDFNNLIYCGDKDCEGKPTGGITNHIDGLRYKDDKKQLLPIERGWSIKPIYANAWQEKPDDTDETGYVQVVHYSEGKAAVAHEQSLREMCDAIRTLLDRGHDPSQMAILIRRKKEMDMVAKAFAEHLPDVPLVSDEIFRLNQSVAVNILMNALRVVLHPDDHASLGRLVYLSAVTGETECEINGLYDGCIGTDFFDTMMGRLPEGFRDLNALRRKPVFELVMALAGMFGVDKLPGQSAYLMTFYDNIAANLSDNSANLATLVRYWDDVLQAKSIPGGEVKGINILTIHRAKGLQWKTVLMPFCDWSLHDPAYPNSIFWSKPKDDSLLCGLPIAAVPLRPGALDSIYSDDYLTELQNQRVDNLNLLYVATTRPEGNLYLWGYGNESKNNNATMMALIANTLAGKAQAHGMVVDETTDEESGLKRTAYTAGTEPDTLHKKKDEDAANRLILKYDTPEIDMQCYPALMRFRQSSEAKRFTCLCSNSHDDDMPTPQQSAYINTGQLLHAIFAEIRSRDTIDDDIQRAIAKLPSGLVSDNTAIAERARRLLMRGLKRRDVTDWFSGRYSLHNECSIVARDKDGQIHEPRPDRVMSDAERVIVVDYKFGHADPEYTTQVQGYMSLLQSMYPAKRVEGYLWYVYSNDVAAVTQDSSTTKQHDQE